MQYLRMLSVFFVTGMLAGCDSKPQEVEIFFAEQEPGVEPYQTRLIVTSDYMRFDDGENSVDFVLLDRKKDIIYSTNSGERTVMSVSPKTNDVKPPIELKQSVKNLGMLKDAPKIQGETA